MQSRTLSDLARLTGLKPRTLQFWTSSGVLVPEAGTRHGGPGVHRKYGRSEIIISAILAKMSHFNFQVGILNWFATEIRKSIDYGHINQISNYAQATTLIGHYNLDEISRMLHPLNRVVKEDEFYLYTCAAILGGIEGKDTAIFITAGEEIHNMISAMSSEYDVGEGAFLTLRLGRILPKIAR